MPFQGFAQHCEHSASITGTVEVIEDSTNLFFFPPNAVENNPQALPNVNITLMRADSTIVAGTVSNPKRGNYTIDGIKPGDYILKAMYVGFESESLSIHLDEGEQLEKDIILGHIYAPEELPFGSDEAVEDIKNGIIEIRTLPTVGCFMCDGEALELAKKIRKKYGFTKRNVADQFKKAYENNWEKLRQAIIRYNATVKKHLANINGADWKKRYEQELRQAEKKFRKKKQR